jgi:hypothetical protein
VGVTKVNTNAIDELYIRGFMCADLFNAADAIRQLQTAYFFDLPEVDDELLAVVRGQATAATISRLDMVVGQEADFETAREQAVEFPLKMHLGYLSAESDYQPTKQTSERRSVDVQARSESTVEISANWEADEAAQIVDAMHKVAWAEAEGRIKVGVDESFAYLVPSDIIVVEVYSGVYKRFRILEAVFADGIIQIQAVVDRASASNLNVNIEAPAPTPRPTPPSNIPSQTEWEFMDLPALHDTHDTLHYYVAGYGTPSSAWYGAQLQRLVGLDYQAEAELTYAHTMGVLDEALPLAPAEYTDTTNTVLVSTSDDLESITNDHFLKGGNGALIGDELIQFRDVVAEGANWRISHLSRGRLNTTPAAHSIGARFVLLANPVLVPAGVALLDTTLTLRCPSYGQIPQAGDESTHAFVGNSQREWAPTNLVIVKQGNDYIITWSPRWRLGNSANPSRSVNFSHWEVRITRSGTTVIRSAPYISDTEAFEFYTEAEQIEDWGSAVSVFTISVAGYNSLAGPGDTVTENYP